MTEPTTTRDPAKGPGGGLLGWLARARGLRRRIPKPLKTLARRLVPQNKYLEALAEAEERYPEESTYPSTVDVTLGILKGLAPTHVKYITACTDLRVPYKVVDLCSPDWVSAIRNCGCDAFLAWPSNISAVWKKMYDDRLRVIAEDLGKVVYPSPKALWLYESKQRMAYWLKANGVPHPRTWIFYRRHEALAFAETAELPIVFKTDIGAGAYGVRVFRKRPALRRCIKRIFRKGMRVPSFDPRHREWGAVLLQEYIPDAAEWRVIRLGKSYFAHQKVRKGDFHSGSKLPYWYDPPNRLLDLAREVTDKGHFTSMNLDVLEATDGRYLVNELQTMYGALRPYQMLVNGRAGRYFYDNASNEWHFEEGIFCQHAGCVARVVALLQMLGRSVDLPKVDAATTVTAEDRLASVGDFARQKAKGVM